MLSLHDPQWLNHQKYSALGTTLPARLLQEALVIFLFKQKSEFRSFGKWLWTLCLPEPVSIFARGPFGSSWDWLPCSGFLQGSVEVLSSTHFSLNSCSQSGNSCNRSICTTSSRSSYFCFRFLLVYAAGFTVALHSYFHLFGHWIFGVFVDVKIQNPVMMMMME